MVGLSNTFSPVLLRGVTIDPQDPMNLEFIVTPGDTGMEGESLKRESEKLIKYFLTSITIPEKDLWVNLSPYEENRIVPNAFGQTEMGRDLLAQDYFLKQLTSSLMYPEDELGKKFWDKVYAELREKYGITDMPVNTFNKVWIVPGAVTIYEHNNSAFVVNSRLKVMLEEDFLALENNKYKDQFNANDVSGAQTGKVSEVSKNAIREVIIPLLEKEVNEGENFVQLRQIYNSLILASWFKKTFRDSFIAHVYAGKNKIAGVNADDQQAKEKIYGQYVEAFNKGVYNYIKEEYDHGKQEVIPRKYFSGGVKAAIIKVDEDGNVEFEKGVSIKTGSAAARQLHFEEPVTFKIRLMAYSPRETERRQSARTWLLGNKASLKGVPQEGDTLSLLGLDDYLFDSLEDKQNVVDSVRPIIQAEAIISKVNPIIHNLAKQIKEGTVVMDPDSPFYNAQKLAIRVGDIAESELEMSYSKLPDKTRIMVELALSAYGLKRASNDTEGVFEIVAEHRNQGEGTDHAMLAESLADRIVDKINRFNEFKGAGGRITFKLTAKKIASGREGQSKVIIDVHDFATGQRYQRLLNFTYGENINFSGNVEQPDVLKYIDALIKTAKQEFSSQQGNITRQSEDLSPAGRRARVLAENLQVLSEKSSIKISSGQIYTLRPQIEKQAVGDGYRVDVYLADETGTSSGNKVAHIIVSADPSQEEKNKVVLMPLANVVFGNAASVDLRNQGVEKQLRRLVESSQKKNFDLALDELKKLEAKEQNAVLTEEVLKFLEQQVEQKSIVADEGTVYEILFDVGPKNDQGFRYVSVYLMHPSGYEFYAGSFRVEPSGTERKSLEIKNNVEELFFKKGLLSKPHGQNFSGRIGKILNELFDLADKKFSQKDNSASDSKSADAAASVTPSDVERIAEYVENKLDDFSFSDKEGNKYLLKIEKRIDGADAFFSVSLGREGETSTAEIAVIEVDAATQTVEITNYGLVDVDFGQGGKDLSDSSLEEPIKETLRKTKTDVERLYFKKRTTGNLNSGVSKEKPQASAFELLKQEVPAEVAGFARIDALGADTADTTADDLSPFALSQRPIIKAIRDLELTPVRVEEGKNYTLRFTEIKSDNNNILVFVGLQNTNKHNIYERIVSFYLTPDGKIRDSRWIRLYSDVPFLGEDIENVKDFERKLHAKIREIIEPAVGQKIDAGLSGASGSEAVLLKSDASESFLLDEDILQMQKIIAENIIDNYSGIWFDDNQRYPYRLEIESKFEGPKVRLLVSLERGVQKSDAIIVIDVDVAAQKVEITDHGLTNIDFGDGGEDLSDAGLDAFIITEINNIKEYIDRMLAEAKIKADLNEKWGNQSITGKAGETYGVTFDVEDENNVEMGIYVYVVSPDGRKASIPDAHIIFDRNDPDEPEVFVSLLEDVIFINGDENLSRGNARRNLERIVTEVKNYVSRKYFSEKTAQETAEGLSEFKWADVNKTFFTKSNKPYFLSVAVKEPEGDKYSASVRFVSKNDEKNHFNVASFDIRDSGITGFSFEPANERQRGLLVNNMFSDYEQSVIDIIEKVSGLDVNKDQLEAASGTASANPPGGILFDPAMITLNIERDGGSSPVTFDPQNFPIIDLTTFEGFYFNIINVEPANLSLMLGLNK
ncbi:MAG: hypothetical protein AB1650_08755 [Candidatus Omnitrophota bacterium]